jgi:hypothetical protein
VCVCVCACVRACVRARPRVVVFSVAILYMLSRTSAYTQTLVSLMYACVFLVSPRTRELACVRERAHSSRLPARAHTHTYSPPQEQSHVTIHPASTGSAR